MSEYIKQIIKGKSDLAKSEQQVLTTHGSLPVLCKANTVLQPLQEVIVKAVYLAGGMFLSDIKKLVYYQSDIQKTERAIKGLIKEGYLIVNNTVMGNLYGLTAEGICQIRYHKDYYAGGRPSTVSTMKIDVAASLMKRKIASALIAEYVFKTETEALLLSFYQTDKMERNIYLMNQYLKNIVYRTFLQKSREERKAQLLSLRFTEEQATDISERDNYSIKNAEVFADGYFSQYGFDTLKKEETYHAYIQFIRKECLHHANENTCYLLKEMLPEKKLEYDILEILQAWRCNILKYGMEHIWKFWDKELTKNEILQREQALEICNQYIKYLGDEKRSLIQTNAYKKKDDEVLLKEITEKLVQLEACLKRLYEQKSCLEADFSFPVLSAYVEEGNNYEERVITFKRLEQNGVYIQATKEGMVTCFIVQTQDEYFDLFTLHRKMAMLYQMCRRLFQLYELRIEILTDNIDQKQFIDSKLIMLQNKLLASRETSVLGNLFHEVLTVKVVHSDMKERFTFYHQILKNVEGE